MIDIMDCFNVLDNGYVGDCQFIFISLEWIFDLICKYDEEIVKCVVEFGLDIYFNQIEVISVEQMMDVYSFVGMLVGYYYWFFGKQFLSIFKGY